MLSHSCLCDLTVNETEVMLGIKMQPFWSEYWVRNRRKSELPAKHKQTKTHTYNNGEDDEEDEKKGKKPNQSNKSRNKFRKKHIGCSNNYCLFESSCPSMTGAFHLQCKLSCTAAVGETDMWLITERNNSVHGKWIIEKPDFIMFTITVYIPFQQQHQSFRSPSNIPLLSGAFTRSVLFVCSFLCQYARPLSRDTTPDNA